MKTFQYKDKRIKYYYMLLFSLVRISLLLAIINDQSNTIPAILLSLPGIIVIFFALSGLWEKVTFANNDVIYKKLLDTRIALDNIRSIKVFNKNDLCYEINTLNGKRLIWSLSFYESDEDIQTFRNALSELIREARLANPQVDIDDHCLLASDGASEYSGKQAIMAMNKRATLTGLGGWLAYLIFNLIISCIGDIQSIVRLFTAASTGMLTPIIIIAVLLYSGSVVLAVISLVLLVKRKKQFAKFYLYYLMVVPSSILVNFIYIILSLETTVNALIVFLNVIVPIAQNIGWYFAWKEYLSRSIRVKNTLGTQSLELISNKVKNRTFQCVLAIFLPPIGFILGFDYFASSDRNKQAFGKKLILCSIITGTIYLIIIFMKYIRFML